MSQADVARAQLSGIVFDFDGVILESVDLKGRAFRRLFSQYPKHVDAIVALHMANGGMSRYEKFRRIYAEFLHLPLTDDDMARLDRELSQIIGEEIEGCRLVEGAAEFLQRRAQEYPLFVVSGTPEREIQTIVARRGLDRFFTGTHGSPTSKEILLERIASRLGTDPARLLFIGDTLLDYRAAVTAGTRFVGRVAPASDNPFPSRVPTVLHLGELGEKWPVI